MVLKRITCVLGRSGLGLLAGAMLQAAQAGSYQVDPIRVEIRPDRPTANLTVVNGEKEPMLFEVSTVRWTQAGGEDVYTPTKEILASPPMFTVPPESTQMVRVGFKHPEFKDQEGSYRIYIAQVPAKGAGAKGISVAVKTGIPVFVAPKNGKTEKMSVELAAENGRSVVKVRNDGNTHLRIEKLDFQEPGRSTASVKQFVYLLPGQSRGLVQDKLFPKGTSVKVIADGGVSERDAVAAEAVSR